jgi:predicted negative regulator of RcsB-dependent stress response
MAQGKAADARAAWQQALDKATAEHPLRQLIQLKLDAVPAPAVS